MHWPIGNPVCTGRSRCNCSNESLHEESIKNENDANLFWLPGHINVVMTNVLALILIEHNEYNTFVSIWIGQQQAMLLLLHWIFYVPNDRRDAVVCVSVLRVPLIWYLWRTVAAMPEYSRELEIYENWLQTQLISISSILFSLFLLYSVNPIHNICQKL